MYSASIRPIYHYQHVPSTRPQLRIFPAIVGSVGPVRCHITGLLPLIVFKCSIFCATSLAVPCVPVSGIPALHPYIHQLYIVRRHNQPLRNILHMVSYIPSPLTYIAANDAVFQTVLLHAYRGAEFCKYLTFEYIPVAGLGMPS